VYRQHRNKHSSIRCPSLETHMALPMSLYPLSTYCLVQPSEHGCPASPTMALEPLARCTDPGRYLGVGTGSPHVLEDASLPSRTYEVPHSTTLFYTILCASRSTRAPSGNSYRIRLPPETPPPQSRAADRTTRASSHINSGSTPSPPECFV
jgi:hypothetical protein